VSRLDEVKWFPNICWWDFPDGTLVKDVPIYSPDFGNTWKYAERLLGRKSRSFLEKVDRTAQHFDSSLFHPLYYCKMCRQLEDGTHRLVVAERLGLNVVDVEVGRVCWKNVYADQSLRQSNYVQFLQKYLKDGDSNYSKWLIACEDKKWNHISGVLSFRGKKVLDVGCNVGYSCLQAWSRGALFILGIDRDKAALSIAMQSMENLCFNRRRQFLHSDWLNAPVEATYGKGFFDVVSCLGMMHYFPEGEYALALSKLCDMGNDHLILELRFFSHGEPDLRVAGKQVLPTRAWLDRELEQNGWRVWKYEDVAHNSKVGERGIFFVEKS